MSTRRRFHQALLAVVLAASQSAIARLSATPLKCASAAGIPTEAEITYIPSQKIYTMNVSFIGKRPPNKEVERVVRDCVAAAVKRDGTKDILGTPWLRKRAGANPDDDDNMDVWGGLRYLSYRASDKSIAVREMVLKKK